MSERMREVPLGQKVTIRHRLDDGAASDAVGPVVERDEDTIVVETRRRGRVRIRLESIIAARIIPQP